MLIARIALAAVAAGGRTPGKGRHVQITHTNRKGSTYYLCRGTTSAGKPRYYFSRQPKDEPVEALPEGCSIVESVNGVVSLVKDRPSPILPDELEAVEGEVRRHPKAANYRVGTKKNMIVIYERWGADPDEIIAIFQPYAPLVRPGAADRVRAEMDRTANFVPVLRFILIDAQQRAFSTERWCYLGSIDDWVFIGSPGALRALASRYIPMLGTEELFDQFM
jgi:hypothetical protein